MQTHPRRVLTASTAFLGFYLGAICFVIVSAFTDLHIATDASAGAHAAFGMVVSEGVVILLVAAGIQLAVLSLLARAYLDLGKVKIFAGQLCLGLLAAWVSSTSVMPWGILIFSAVSALVARAVLLVFPSIARPSENTT